MLKKIDKNKYTYVKVESKWMVIFVAIQPEFSVIIKIRLTHQS
jgi:transposase-like protein